MTDEQQRRKPGPRTKRAKMIVTTISMPQELKDELDAAAEAHDLSIAEVMRLALGEWLEKHGRHYGQRAE